MVSFASIALAERAHRESVMKTTDRPSARCLRRPIGRCLSAALVASLGATSLVAQHGHGSEGVGTAHMETSCLPAVQAKFDRALALLHNFWYARALTTFEEVQKADPACAMAYWGAAMTYNHPFWDAPTPDDLSAAWAHVQKGLTPKSQNDRERMYLLAVSRALQGRRRRAEAGPRRGLPRADGRDLREVSRRRDEVVLRAVDARQRPRRREGLRDAGPCDRPVRVGLRARQAASWACCTT